MSKTDLDIRPQSAIMSPDEVAQFFQKSTSWVYKNWKILGGVKLGGSLFFPSKEDLYERLFEKKQGVEVRFHPQGDQTYKNLVQDKKRGSKSRSTKKGGIKEPTAATGKQNRHGILGVG